MRLRKPRWVELTKEVGKLRKGQKLLLKEIGRTIPGEEGESCLAFVKAYWGTGTVTLLKGEYKSTVPPGMEHLHHTRQRI